MVVGKIRGEWKKIGVGGTNIFPMFCVLSQRYLRSLEKLCVPSQNFCVLSQRYLRSLAKLLRSLAKIFAFPRKYICVLSRNFAFPRKTLAFSLPVQHFLFTLRLMWFRQLRTFIMEQFIEFYFELGLKYKEIRAVLSTRHGFYVSERHLKRILREKGLSRRKSYSALADLVDFISHQLQYSGQLHGYRWMYTKCRDRGLRVRKEDVRMVLKELDPAGVSMRRARRLRRRNYFAKGPNFIWHLDSYDKLKPYGVCINGCIDGFSRKIIWLNAYTTSSDPKLIGGYYIEVVERLGGCPRVVRGDLGTENGHVRDFQRFLNISHEDETLDSYLEGASTANQRIEYWWGFLRKECMEFWISLFANLRDSGFFDGGFLDKSLLQFCCMGLIQVSLYEIMFCVCVCVCVCERDGGTGVTKLDILSLLTPLFQTIQQMTVFGETKQIQSSIHHPLVSIDV